MMSAALEPVGHSDELRSPAKPAKRALSRGPWSEKMPRYSMDSGSPLRGVRGAWLMREEAGGWVYILASKRNGTLYTGSARELLIRVTQHRENVMSGFTSKYGVTRLVWWEAHASIASAAARERQIKRWRRAWKVALIEKDNPTWEDFYPSIAVFGALPEAKS